MILDRRLPEEPVSAMHAGGTSPSGSGGRRGTRTSEVLSGTVDKTRRAAPAAYVGGGRAARSAPPMRQSLLVWPGLMWSASGTVPRNVTTGAFAGATASCGGNRPGV